MSVTLLKSVSHSQHYSQSTSRVTSISETEMNIRIPLCNVWYLKGLSEKDALTEKKKKKKKVQNTWKTIVILEILNAVM